jgi:hypothetical protein
MTPADCKRTTCAGFLSKRAGDVHNEGHSVQNFMLTYRNAPAADQAKLEALWTEAGLGAFPKPSA